MGLKDGNNIHSSGLNYYTQNITFNKYSESFYDIKGRDQGLLDLTGQADLLLGGQDIPVTVSSSETRMDGGGVR